LVSIADDLHLLGWSCNKTPPFQPTSFTSLFPREQQLSGAEAVRIILDGLCKRTKASVTLAEPGAEGGRAVMLPYGDRHRFCEDVAKNADHHAECLRIAQDLGDKYLGLHRSDPEVKGIEAEEPPCWLIKNCYHFVSPVFVNGRILALAFGGRLIPKDEWSPSLLSDRRVPRDSAGPIYRDVVKGREAYDARRQEFREAVPIISKIGEDRYQLERRARDGRFLREIEALYSTSRGTAAAESVILERVVEYMVFQVGALIELREVNEQDAYHAQVRVRTMAINPAMREEVNAGGVKPLPEVPLSTTREIADALFPANLRILTRPTDKEVLQSIAVLLGSETFAADTACVAPIHVSNHRKLGLLLVNRGRWNSSKRITKTVSNHCVEALTALQMTLRQQQRHIEARDQTSFTLIQVEHELSLATDGVLQFGDLLKKQGHIQEERDRIMKVISSEVELIGALRDKIDFYNKLVDGKTLPRRDRTYRFYAEIVRPKVNLLLRRAQAGKVRIDHDSHEQTDMPRLSLDAGLIGQVLLNLLDNAVKYADQLSTVVFKAGYDAGRLWFSVENKGIGIPENERRFIFFPGVRCSNTWTVSAKGSGIGLYVAREITRALGGNIEVVSSTPEKTVLKAYVAAREVKEDQP
jgi:signal transduction histidine kinase